MCFSVTFWPTAYLHTCNVCVHAGRHKHSRSEVLVWPFDWLHTSICVMFVCAHVDAHVSILDHSEVLVWPWCWLVSWVAPLQNLLSAYKNLRSILSLLLSSALIRLLFVCMLCSLLLQQLSKDKAPDPVVTQVEWVEPMSVYLFSLVLTPPPSLALFAVRKVGRAWYFSICSAVDFGFPPNKVLMWAFVLAYCTSTFRHTRAIYNSQLPETRRT